MDCFKTQRRTLGSEGDPHTESNVLFRAEQIPAIIVSQPEFTSSLFGELRTLHDASQENHCRIVNLVKYVGLRSNLALGDSNSRAGIRYKLQETSWAKMHRMKFVRQPLLGAIYQHE